MKIKRIKKIKAIEFFKKLNNEENTIFFNSYTKDGWEKIISFNPVKKLTITKKITNEKIIQFIEENKDLFIAGYISYDYGAKQHVKTLKAKNTLKMPEIELRAYANLLKFKSTYCEIHYKQNAFIKKVEEINNREVAKEVTKNKEGQKRNNFKKEINTREYSKYYKIIKNHIKKGNIYQINMTHRLKGKSNLSGKSLFMNIMKHNKVGHLAYIKNKKYEILSASPERFIKITNKKIISSPIKGTRPRNTNKTLDNKNKSELLRSEKEKNELNMITDLIRNDLGKIAKIGSVKVEIKRGVKKCPEIWHTYSKISALIKDDTHPMEAVLSMLPGGSITGCPKKRAIEIIDKCEKYSRSIYTGIIGYINGPNDIDFSIAIRTVIKIGKNLYLNVGGGIVLDSKENSEYKETWNKAKSFMKII